MTEKGRHCPPCFYLKDPRIQGESKLAHLTNPLGQIMLAKTRNHGYTFVIEGHRRGRGRDIITPQSINLKLILAGKDEVQVALALTVSRKDVRGASHPKSQEKYTREHILRRKS